MEKHIIDKNTGIGYNLNGDYYIPDLALSEDEYEIGKFGRLHLKYLKEHKHLTYAELFSFGKLNAYLHDVDSQAQEMFDRLVKEYAERQGVTEQFKAENQMAWVGETNNIRANAMEIVVSEIVNK